MQLLAIVIVAPFLQLVILNLKNKFLIFKFRFIVVRDQVTTDKVVSVNSFVVPIRAQCVPTD